MPAKKLKKTMTDSNIEKSSLDEKIKEVKPNLTC